MGGWKLKDGGAVDFRCLTRDGKQGTITFTLHKFLRDGKHITEDIPYQLENGRLFLVATKRKRIVIQQLDQEISDANNEELEKLVKEDAKIADFMARGETSATP